MIVAGTGHRPDKLGGYSYQIGQRLTNLAVAGLRDMGATVVISGMALGWDLAIADASIILDIPLIAAIPFEGQEKKWPESSQARYTAIRAQARFEKIICEGSYAPEKMQVRNEWMVNSCDKVLALFNGTKGGTMNCLNYALLKKKPIVNLWHMWQEV